MEEPRHGAPRAEAVVTPVDDIIETLPVGFLLCDAEDRIVTSNSLFRKWFFPGVEHLVTPGRHYAEVVRDFIGSGSCAEARRDPRWLERRMALRRDPGRPFEYHLPNDRVIETVETRTGNGGLVSIHTDVTDRRRTQAALSRRDEELTEQLERFNIALENMSQGLCMFDADKRLVVCNDRYTEIYGLPPELVRPGTPFRDIIMHRIRAGVYSGSPEAYLDERLAAIDEAMPSTKVHHLQNGRVVAIVHQPMSNGGWVATHEDITELHRVQAQNEYLAHHDALTGLPNRNRLGESIERALAGVRRGQDFAVLCLDLDRFKQVNDTLGHAGGDELLKAVGARLCGCVRETDMVARLGGDEFAVVQVGGPQPTAADRLAVRICETVGQVYELMGHQVIIDTSIGVAVASQDGETADELLRNADMALYAAKGNGRGTYSFFEPGMDSRMKARRELEFDLRRGLEGNEFELHYQPLISVETLEVTGLEALLRWRHPTRGVVSPGAFVELAEEIGLIVPLGEWVVRQACAEAANWPDHVRIAVNLSPVQFQRGDVVAMVASALGNARLPASRLELEITETVLMQENEATLKALHHLRALGVNIALDDFGTGYSSLSYLRRFPFDKIKMDGSFVSDLAGGGEAVAIVRAVAGLGRSLGMATTAEAVETQAQLECIRAEGFTEMQGYLFSRPREIAEIRRQFFPDHIFPAHRCAAER